MKVFLKVIATLLTIVVMGIFGISMWGSIGTLPYTFIGEKSFSTLEEMQQFQTEVVLAVKDAGGTVQSFDLSVQSPPKVIYRLYVPSTLQFHYGEQGLNFWVANIMGGGLTLIALVAAGFVSYSSIWKTN